MAKRKRLTPPNPTYLEDAPDKGLTPLGPRKAAPIAAVAGDSSASAALDEVTQTLVRAREEGRLIIGLPLAQIRQDYLVRDRIPVQDEDMQALIESLRTRGQQTPIEVAKLGDGNYGLISGWRRYQALAHLYKETGDAKFNQVLALLRRLEEAPDAYLAMIEENEIRVGLSYFERARIARKAVEQGVFESDRKALSELFRNASRAKRSKIGLFLPIVEALDGVLLFPTSITERLGLDLGRQLKDKDSAKFAKTLRKALKEARPETPEQEQVCLRNILEPADKKVMERALEPEEVKSKPTPKTPNITVKEGGNGELILSGEGIDDEFRKRLLKWLG